MHSCQCYAPCIPYDINLSQIQHWSVTISWNDINIAFFYNSVPVIFHFAVPTAVTALDTERMSNISLRVTWGLPEVLNGILVYYAVNVSSTSVGYFETWRIAADDPLQLNISGLGMVSIVSRSLSSFL